MTPAARGATVAGWWPWLVLPAVASALVCSGLVLALVTGIQVDAGDQVWVNLPLAIGFSTVAAGIWSTRPGPPMRRLAVLYTVVGLGSALVMPSYAWAHTGLASVPGDLPATTAAGWLSNWVWALGAAPLLGIGILLYPDARLPGRRWWPALALGITAPVLLALSGALRPGPMEALPSRDNPLGVASTGFWDVVGGLGFLATLTAGVAGLVALFVKYRRAPVGGDRRRQILGFLLAAGLVVIAGALPAGAGVAPGMIGLAAGIALPVTVGDAVVRHRLLDQRADVERLSRRLDTVAESRRTLVSEREEERLRLRRELHDGLGPSLAAIGLGLRQLQATLPQGEQAASVKALGDEVQRAVGEVRRICQGLRPGELAELGLPEAIAAATDRLGAFGGPRITVRADDLPALSPAIEVATFRVVLEAITNAVRHSGGSCVEVRLAYDGGVAIEVEDDGSGLSPAAVPGVGLGAMAERADELGGWLRTGVGRDGGTVVKAWLPDRVDA